MTRTKSELICYEKLSPNITKPRSGPIRRITPHCVAGNLTVEAILGLAHMVTYDVKLGASCTYAIGTDGRVGLGVEETNRPWTTSGKHDHEAITFEIANVGGAPDWRISDEAINTWLTLSVELCKTYGFKKIHYETKPATVKSTAVEEWIKTWAKQDEMIITLHSWYVNKDCPGPYFIRQLPWLAKEINRRLAGEVSQPFVGEGKEPPHTQPRETWNEEPYQVTITTQALNIRSGPGAPSYPVLGVLMNDRSIYTIVDEAEGPGAKRWGKLKSGAGWISLDYTTKV